MPPGDIAAVSGSNDRAADRVEHDADAACPGDLLQPRIQMSSSADAITWAAPASSKACRLAEVRVSAIGIAPILFAIWIAASPTLLDAAVMTTTSPRSSPAMSISAP